MAFAFRGSFREIIDVRKIPDSTENYSGDIVAAIPLLDLLWGDGTDAGEADDFWADPARAITGSATQNIDLKALANGPGGSTVNFAEVRGILVRNRSTNGDVLTLAVGAANGWTALGAAFEIEIPVGGYFRLLVPTDGALPVGAADKVIDITNGSGSVAAYDIALIGTTA